MSNQHSTGATRYLRVRMMLTSEIGKRLQSGSKHWRYQKRGIFLRGCAQSALRKRDQRSGAIGL
eukprot:2547725-Pleurochrysis_carterae.AAC.1